MICGAALSGAFGARLFRAVMPAVSLRPTFQAIPGVMVPDAIPACGVALIPRLCRFPCRGLAALLLIPPTAAAHLFCGIPSCCPSQPGVLLAIIEAGRA